MLVEVVRIDPIRGKIKKEFQIELESDVIDLGVSSGKVIIAGEGVKGDVVLSFSRSEWNQLVEMVERGSERR